MSWSGPRKIGIPSPPYKGTGKKLTKKGKALKRKTQAKKNPNHKKNKPFYDIFKGLKYDDKRELQHKIDADRVSGKKIIFKEATTIDEVVLYTKKYLSFKEVYEFNQWGGDSHKIKKENEDMIAYANTINKHLTDLYNEFPTIPRLGKLRTLLGADNSYFFDGRDIERTRNRTLKNSSSSPYTEISIGIGLEGPQNSNGIIEKIKSVLRQDIKHTKEVDLPSYRKSVKSWNEKAKEGYPNAEAYARGEANNAKKALKRIKNNIKRIAHLDSISKKHKQKKKYYDYNLIHTMYNFPQTRSGGIEATVRHEFGHAVHTAYFDKINAVVSKIREKEYKDYWIGSEPLKKGGLFPTERARDLTLNRKERAECVAENFSLYSIGKKSYIHPEMVKMFDKIKAGTF